MPLARDAAAPRLAVVQLVVPNGSGRSSLARAVDAGVDAAIVERLAAAPDHRAKLCFPEAKYLKGLALLRAE
jgi:hypothetical protein